MSRPLVKIVNATTGKEVEREMNDKEFAQYEADLIRFAEIDAAEAAREAAKQSAREKLAALGLTEAEIQALAG